MHLLASPTLVALLALFYTHALPAASISGAQESEKLFGWQGETYHGPSTARNSTGWIETIAWQPRAFIWHGFLSDAECEHLKDLARDKLERSLVVSDVGDGVDPVRTSYSASIGTGRDEVVRAIEDRIARWTHLPVRHGEPIEVLRYINGQKYDAHWDWFEEKEVKSEGNRVATVLMYLSDTVPGGGGETALPLAQAIDPTVQTLEGMSECAGVMGISIKPRQGDTLLFWDMHPDGQRVDRHALHASCPTTQGEKWTATKWIHTNRYT